MADLEAWHEVLCGVAGGLIESGLDVAAAEVYSGSSYVLDVLDGIRDSDG